MKFQSTLPKELFPYRCGEVRSPQSAGHKGQEIEEFLRCDPASSDDTPVLLHSQVFGVNAHHQLDQRGQRQQEKDGREGDVVRKVQSFAIAALVLNLKLIELKFWKLNEITQK